MGAFGSKNNPNVAFTLSDVIETKSGKLKGKRFTFEDGKNVDAFLGIPYGKPPVGERRFKVNF